MFNGLVQRSGVIPQISTIDDERGKKEGGIRKKDPFTPYGTVTLHTI
ncbi:MAG: hypothetical protein M9911_11125 [Saprospiraceae bacterium]|nr:hypothetical protein [Saprospiraceae bacterium]